MPDGQVILSHRLILLSFSVVAVVEPIVVFVFITAPVPPPPPVMTRSIVSASMLSACCRAAFAAKASVDVKIKNVMRIKNFFIFVLLWTSGYKPVLAL